MSLKTATPHSIRTFTGKFFDFTVMDPDTICIEDIAHALAHEPRFSGHTPKPYSVAKHSLAAMVLAPDHLKLEAMLHDATEAYMKDIAKPLKTLLPDYCALEAKLEKVIADKFLLQYPLPKIIKDIDVDLLHDEYDGLFRDSNESFAYLLAADAFYVKSQFLLMYEIHKRV